MKQKATNVNEPNAPSELTELQKPYYINIRIQGTVPFLFHRWNTEEVELKSNAQKNSKIKKTDNLESYVFRHPNGNLAIPGLYLRSSVVTAAKAFPDPRSPRKSCRDLINACLICNTEYGDTGNKQWDYEDKRRVVIQRSAITRTRPALNTGYEVELVFSMTQPELIQDTLIYNMFDYAGKFCGIGDFRPIFGLFKIIKFTHSTDYDKVMKKI